MLPAACFLLAGCLMPWDWNSEANQTSANLSEEPSLSPQASATPFRQISSKSVELGQFFELKPGEGARIAGEGVEVVFEKVDGDSRCALGATCVWEGQAKAVMRLRKASVGVSNFELVLRAGRGNLAEQSVGGYLISFQELSPYPVLGKEIDAGEYVGKFVVLRESDKPTAIAGFEEEFALSMGQSAIAGGELKVKALQIVKDECKTVCSLGREIVVAARLMRGAEFLGEFNFSSDLKAPSNRVKIGEYEVVLRSAAKNSAGNYFAKFLVGKEGFVPTPTPLPTLISTTTPTPTAEPTATPAPSPTPVPTPKPAVFRVEIKNYSYLPAEIEISKGDIIQWVNLDSAPHNAVSQSAPSNGNFYSPILSEGKNASIRFNFEGEYEYYCTLHPWMKGKIVVK